MLVPSGMAALEITLPPLVAEEVKPEPPAESVPFCDQAAGSMLLKLSE